MAEQFSEKPKFLRRHRRVLLAVAALLIALLAWIGLAARVLLAVDEIRPADAVVVLSGDPLGDRVETGVRAFYTSGAGRLIVSVETLGPVYNPRHDLLVFLEANDVPASAMRLIGPASSTAHEAGLVAGWARRCGWKHVIVVTSPYHTRRAGWLFRRALSGTRVTAVAANQSVHPWTWWAHERETEEVLLEWVKALASLRYLFTAPAVRDPGLPC
jgi:hypothetical protein